MRKEENGREAEQAERKRGDSNKRIRRNGRREICRKRENRRRRDGLAEGG